MENTYVLIVILTIATIILMAYRFYNIYNQTPNRLDVESFQSEYDNAISFGIIEEKMKKYDNACAKARTPVIKSTLDSDASRNDTLKTLTYYTSEVQKNLNNIMDVGDSSNQSALDKIKQSVDLMSLQDRASHYYFLNRLSGASTN